MRSDFLVSVGVVDEHGPQVTIPRLAELLAGLAGRFRYFEVIYVVSERFQLTLETMTEQTSRLANLRIILTGEGSGFYRQRTIAASEAIGDVVALLDLDDLQGFEFARRLSEAKDANEILIGWQAAGRKSDWSYRLLSLCSRNIITAQAARTIILPRERLNALFARRSASLDLRFEPRTPPSRYRRFDIGGPARSRGGLARRYELLTEILLTGAPRYLKAYAGAGFIVSVCAIFYALYAISVPLFRDRIQEGWFSTAIAQAGSTAFIAGGMSILAIALAAILERLNGGDEQMIVDEIANITFFDKATDLNVEVSQGLAAVSLLNAAVRA